MMLGVHMLDQVARGSSPGIESIIVVVVNIIVIVVI